jgi:hypothetical protein
MGLKLRFIERMLKLQFSKPRNFTLQPLRRYDVKPPEKTAVLPFFRLSLASHWSCFTTNPSLFSCLPVCSAGQSIAFNTWHNQFFLTGRQLILYLPNDLDCMRCKVDVSPIDVSPTESSWMLCPLDKASLGYCAPDRCVSTLDRVTHRRHNAWTSYSYLTWPAVPTSPEQLFLPALTLMFLLDLTSSSYLT